MTNQLSKNATKIQEALAQRGYGFQVVEFSQSTRSAQEAADTIGCKVEQIAKTLIFKGKKSSKPVIVIASGPNRVDEKKIKEVFGEAISKADADFVREVTGYPIGGVPPVGHTQPIETFIDADLEKYEEIWAAAGTPNAVFSLTPEALSKITNGRQVKLS